MKQNVFVCVGVGVGVYTIYVYMYIVCVYVYWFFPPPIPERKFFHNHKTHEKGFLLMLLSLWIEKNHFCKVIYMKKNVNTEG